ncbi:MAG: YaiO family outer membrane beta-barrel protein [Bacteroidetes bacterium]|nr:MAG: YaiO family outer membrane beta-barrel protein [Bacteroidota bacterium]REK06936.1 MAG: YaiO family outer membrane beta-barrel protein [Bacteroidota bacterium]REK33717.1 MAG: YaiO family outer membrane beta-barrel protein [Bacteroidota bacterium]REK49388.1 MAG: YaiO family outer membrane beta-barrel protein [Bacteroidota bacterium]
MPDNNIRKYFSIRIIGALAYCIFLHFLPADLFAQTGRVDTVIIVTDTTDLDRLFKRARDFSYAGNHNQARRICYKILEKKPTYYDVRTFIGRTFAWEQQYDNARTELGRVLIEKENDQEALLTLIDVEYWTNNLEVAKEYMRIAVSNYPTSQSVMLKKAKLLLREGEKESAAITLQRVLDINPGNREALVMLNSMNENRLSNKFQVSYSNDFYDIKDAQKLLSAEMGRSFLFGSIIYRASYAEKFNDKGLQSEADAYVRFVKSNYLYLNVGFSDSKLFPDLRAGVEMFQKLPKSFELSGGYRYLQFSTPGTSIYTGSLGKYHKDYWFSFRTYLTPKVSLGTENFLQKTSQTYILNIRKYLDDADNYIGFRAGRGQSPDDRKLSEENTPRLKSIQGALEYQRRAFGRWVMKGDITYSNEEVRTEVYQNRITIGVQMKTVF